MALSAIMGKRGKAKKGEKKSKRQSSRRTVGRNRVEEIQTPRDEPPPFTEEDVKAEADAPLPNRELRMGEHLFLELPQQYEFVQYLGHGAFGEVCEAAIRGKEGREGKVAIKKQKGFFGHRKDAKLLLRELRILRLLSHHDNIVTLHDIICPQDPDTFDRLFVVFEYVDTDLRKLLDSNQDFTDLHVQYMLYQILLGVKFMHSADIIHRDLKPANILVNANCSLKICDFGLARGIEELTEGKAEIDPDADEPTDNVVAQASDARREVMKKHQLTRHVVTRWYRCPEVLLLEQRPGQILKAIDMWSVGCILGDLFKMIAGNHDRSTSRKRRPLFPGGQSYLTNKDPFTWQNQKDQLNVIFGIMGTPSGGEIEQIRDEHARQFLGSLAPVEKRDLQGMFPSCSATSLDLLNRLLTFLPTDRMTVNEAIEHPYLEGIRYPDNEHVTERATFEFEEGRTEIPELRELIKQEIAHFHPEIGGRQESAV